MNRQFWHRNAATVLTVLGGAGVVVTSVMAVKATPKALKKIEEAEREKGEELSKWETVKVTGTTYIPTILVGASTIACIFGSNILNKRQQASLASAYAFIDQSYKEYQNKVKELYGEETHQEIIDAIAAEKAKEVGITADCMCTNTCLTSDEACGEPVLFYDEWSQRFFESTIEQVITAQYHTNRNFVLRGYTTLNELYDFLGLEPTDYGNTVGWTVEDELYWIDFNQRKIALDNSIECYIIETPWGPSADFLEYY